MKLIHLSDLHLGKRVNDFSMLEDQKYILTKILNIIDNESPDAVLIAGDVYDKAVPSVEAVTLFDDFLRRLFQRGLKVFAISGNHDSPERLAFGARLMSEGGVYLSPVYDGTVAPFALTDAFGTVNIYLLPFLKPAHVRRWHPEEEIGSYNDALRAVLRRIDLDTQSRNVLVTHQFVTGASRSDSEDLSVGGADNVDAALFEAFDYVALGHLHAPQSVGRETLRYCGTPLKYSFSEAGHQKSVTVAELSQKGVVTVRTVPLTPKRELSELRGSYMELTARSFYEALDLDAYYRVTLTDEEDIPDAVGKLRSIYPNIMKLEYDNTRTRLQAELTAPADAERKTPLDLFSEFYEKQNNRPLSQEQSAYVKELMESIWEGAL